ncbi:MAG: hypothetical protein M3Y12_11645 [Bacteroidota bacterium]|nr:hypothetical protein [Bacteroidota bacterium]
MLKLLLFHRLRSRASLLALLLVLGSVVAAYAATLTLFTAAYSGTVVRVEWEVSNEVDVTGFELARKSVADASYTLVSTTAATGLRRYLYLDTNVYRGTGTTGTLGGPYTYRLTVRSTTGDQSYLTVLAGTPSAVQRSWGTIKSMFR